MKRQHVNERQNLVSDTYTQTRCKNPRYVGKKNAKRPTFLFTQPNMSQNALNTFSEESLLSREIICCRSAVVSIYPD